MRKILLSVLLIVGFVLLFSEQIKNYFFQKEQKIMLEAFEKGKAVVPSDSIWNRENIEDSPVVVEEKNNSESVKSDFSDSMQGILEIPKIDLKIGIFEGATIQHLNAGVATINPHQAFAQGNYAIAGHRAYQYGKQFNRLDELKKGDEIKVRNRQQVYTYQVTETFIVDRHDTSVLNDNGENVITLITCTPAGKKNPTDRLVVRGKLIQKG